MNIIATGHAAAILGPRRLILVPAVIAEALFVYGDDSMTTRLLIDRELLQRIGLETYEAILSDDEVALYVKYASVIDDGEAQVVALAKNRKLQVLTDDNGAIKVATRLGLRIETTLKLARAWAVSEEHENVVRAMRSLRARANYAAPRMHPERDWYLSILDDSTT